MAKTRRTRTRNRGKLKIGDDWNAITIIALSQSNPLKAVAELVENCIDARARHVQITRGKEKGLQYLRISDDGEGLPRNPDGLPDFKYVATHICDSIKRKLKAEGVEGLQGEFGIGLLSFWTIGEELTLTSAGDDGRTYQMTLAKGEPGYTIREKRTLVPIQGTEVRVAPILPGLRQLTGEKIQWYLASELRDRIRQTGISIKIVDRQARKEYKVEPRAFSGRLLHELPPTAGSRGDLYLELYLAEHNPENAVGLYRSGTRVIERLDEFEPFQGGPWSSGYLQGIVDAPFLNLTPGTRSGLIHDEAYAEFCRCLKRVEPELTRIIEEQRRAEEERASRHLLRTIRKAFREALLALPMEEYDWFDIQKRSAGYRERAGDDGADPKHNLVAEEQALLEPEPGERSVQKQFFEFAGPLFSLVLSPGSCVVQVGTTRNFKAVPRDKQRKRVEDDLRFDWAVVEGEGELDHTGGEIATFRAPAEPGLTRIRTTVRQRDTVCEADAYITVSETLIKEEKNTPENRRGLPGYTYHRAPGENWRSRYDAEHNLIVVNNGHRDYVYASRAKAQKARYIGRLFAKELVLKNFPGLPADQLLERLIELSMRTEEHLK